MILSSPQNLDLNRFANDNFRKSQVVFQTSCNYEKFHTEAEINDYYPFRHMELFKASGSITEVKQQLPRGYLGQDRRILSWEYLSALKLAQLSK